MALPHHTTQYTRGIIAFVYGMPWHCSLCILCNNGKTTLLFYRMGVEDSTMGYGVTGVDYTKAHANMANVM